MLFTLDLTYNHANMRQFTAALLGLSRAKGASRLSLETPPRLVLVGQGEDILMRLRVSLDLSD